MLQQQQQQQLPIDFQLTTVHVDQNQPGYDGVPLVKWLQELKVPLSTRQ